MKDKIDYITYIGNIRAYVSENDAEAAAADAVRLDAAIVEQASPKNIMSIVMGAKSHLKATFARSLRVGRLFYADFLSKIDEGTLQFLRSVAYTVPKAYQKALGGGTGMGLEFVKRLLSDLQSDDDARISWAKGIVNAHGRLVGRILQDDVYALASDKGRNFLLELAHNTNPVVRRLFVSQVMTGDAVDAKSKVGVYSALRPFKEYTTRERHEDIKIATRILGHKAYVNGAHNGLTKAYSDNANAPDYQLAVCEKVQETYAESGYIRYQWSRSKLPGYRIIRCSFPRFASMKDSLSGTIDRDTIGALINEENPGSLALMCDMYGVRFGLEQIVYLMRQGRGKLLSYIARDLPELLGKISRTEILFYVSAYGDWDVAMEVVRAIEAVEPGTVAGAVDHFGNTPIWYTQYVFNSTDWYSPNRTRKYSCADYIQMLESFGCSRYRKNHLGISYADVENRQQN